MNLSMAVSADQDAFLHLSENPIPLQHQLSGCQAEFLFRGIKMMEAEISSTPVVPAEPAFSANNLVNLFANLNFSLVEVAFEATMTFLVMFVAATRTGLNRRPFCYQMVFKLPSIMVPEGRTVQTILAPLTIPFLAINNDMIRN
jgi:hypothetical protein